MGDIVGIVIFLAVIVISIARNLHQQKKSSKGSETLTREDLPEAYRRKVYGEPGPAADVKGPERKSADSTEPQRSTGRQLFEALFGDEEADWEPVPPQRSELPRQAPSSPAQKPPPLPQTQPSAPVRQQQRPPVRQEPKRRPARTPAPQETRRQPTRPTTARLRQAPTRKKSAKPAYIAKALERAKHQMHGHAPGRHPAPVAVRRTRKKLFSTKDELRRAIILREVLGPPKAME